RPSLSRTSRRSPAGASALIATSNQLTRRRDGAFCLASSVLSMKTGRFNHEIRERNPSPGLSRPALDPLLRRSAVWFRGTRPLAHEGHRWFRLEQEHRCPDRERNWTGIGL